MAYGAVISLMRRIKYLLNSTYDLLVPSVREIIEFAYKEVESEEFAKRISWSSTSSLDLEIKAAVSKLEDVVEQIVSQKWLDNKDGIQYSSIVLQNLRQDIHFYIQTLKEYLNEYNPLPDEEEDDAVASRIDFGGDKCSKMVGLSDVYDELKDRLLLPSRFDGPEVVSLRGMPGIGKTTLAKKIFEDPDIMEHFECRVWVTVGRKCQLKEIPRRVLAQLNPDSDQMLAELGDDDIAGYLKESLKGKTFLIVLDDVWNKYMAHNLNPSIQKGIKELKLPFLDDLYDGCHVLLTTRLQQVDESNVRYPCDLVTMRLMNNEESWELLREKVFAQELCSPQLEKAGKKIAEQCDGLPLTIVTVADLLSTSEKTPEYWSEVATQKNHQLFIVAYNEISKVLLPIYKYLSRPLQMCFLYMGIFPQNYKISRAKVINMWNADGFLQPNVHKVPSFSAIQCLEELLSSSLVMMHQCTIGSTTFMEDAKQIKTCRLHSSLWHLSNREAEKTNFFHVLNSLNDGLGENIGKQCRLSFHNNILFAIKDVYKSVEANCASTAHSLLCYGPYHQYQVPIYFGLGLLRILDALTIHFYEFPLEALQLVQLRYLALTLNGELPASISQLSNLQFFVVNRHMSIKSSRTPSYLPVEIWNMKELQHLQAMGSDLPDPCGASLESLLKLSNVSAHSCTEAVLQAIPNLEKLGIRIELMPNDDGKPLSCFYHISHLYALKSLKCVIVNPEIVSPPASLSILPSSLIKLSLSGLGYPWKEMSKIATLPHLKVLKLRNYAFQGSEWKVEEKGFTSLRALVIEDTDLVEWKVGWGSIQNLLYLCIKHCYKLEKIHGEIRHLRAEIEFVDCNPLGVEAMKNATWAKVSACSSWKDEKLKI